MDLCTYLHSTGSDYLCKGISRSDRKRKLGLRVFCQVATNTLRGI